MTWLLVAIGGAIGAPLRYVVDRTVQARHDGHHPWGTFAANLLACALLGSLAGAAAVSGVPDGVLALLGAGLAGALSTYSTFSFETVRLAETGAPGTALTYAVGSVVTGLAVASAAGAVVRALLG